MFTLGHLLLTTAMIPSVALAGNGDATLAIDNTFDGEVEVFVDGRFEGVARADRTTRYDVGPAPTRSSSPAPGPGFVLEAATVRLTPHDTTTLPVHAPAGTVRIDNQGEVALKLDLGKIRALAPAGLRGGGPGRGRAISPRSMPHPTTPAATGWSSSARCGSNPAWSPPPPSSPTRRRS